MFGRHSSLQQFSPSLLAMILGEQPVAAVPRDVRPRGRDVKGGGGAGGDEPRGGAQVPTSFGVNKCECPDQTSSVATISSGAVPVCFGVGPLKEKIGALS